MDDVKKAVREVYGKIGAAGGRGTGGCCGPERGASACCAPPGAPAAKGSKADAVSKAVGYSEEELAAVPEGANLGLGCGNPQAIAALRPGETVLDLGSGGGLDCFLAARAAGPEGRVIGVDMTPEMLSRARANAEKAGLSNVEFRLGEIEHLPVADASVDVIISNCVINLSPDRPAVYREAFRVLRSGGRLAITDLVATRELPEEVRRDLALQAGCVAGAATVAQLEAWLAEAGFRDIRILPALIDVATIEAWLPVKGIAGCIASASIEAVKP